MAHKSFPISIRNTSMIPDDLVTSSVDRKLTKVYKVLNYELMVPNNLTMRHLHEMQCDLQHIIHSWGDPPHAKNLDFNGSTKKIILAVHMALQSTGLRKRFHLLWWFDMGMTMGDLMQMQLAISVLLTFNLSVHMLLENNANDYGRSWQSLFGPAKIGPLLDTTISHTNNRSVSIQRKGPQVNSKFLSSGVLTTTVK